MVARRLSILLVGLLAFVVGAPAGAVTAATYPPTVPPPTLGPPSGVTVSDALVAPGSTVTLTAFGYDPGTTVTVTVTGPATALVLSLGPALDRAGTAALRSTRTSRVAVGLVVKGLAGAFRAATTRGTDVADARGVVSSRIKFTRSGRYTVTVTGRDPDGSFRRVTTQVRVAVGAGAGRGSSRLPRTGGDYLPYLLVGGVLIVGGTGAVVAARRRRQSAAA
jgi:LPXTG-motif cell wall-anchored protein